MVATFVPVKSAEGSEEMGDVEISVKGLWKEVILYEVCFRFTLFLIHKTEMYLFFIIL